MRRNAKIVKIGRVKIGGTEPIAVQTMLCNPWHDTAANVESAKALQAAGCDILRVAVPNREAVELISALKNSVEMPIVADIHFDYKLAVLAAEVGADKIRINPGNIGHVENLKAVVAVCKAKNIPVRVGVNSGSLEKNLLQKHGGVTPEALCESATQSAMVLEQLDFDNIVVAIKSSSVPIMVKACELFARQCDYPLHLGVTEAGTKNSGTMKAAAGLGALLLHGIGDTIRVSLTEDPLEEILAGQELLRVLGLRGGGVQIISCPTCGRTAVNLFELARNVERALRTCEKPLRVAVMGCAVNGPGEAADADVGVACGEREGLIFRKGKIVKKVPENEILMALLREVETL